ILKLVAARQADAHQPWHGIAGTQLVDRIRDLRTLVERSRPYFPRGSHAVVHVRQPSPAIAALPLLQGTRVLEVGPLPPVDGLDACYVDALLVLANLAAAPHCTKPMLILDRTLPQEADFMDAEAPAYHRWILRFCKASAAQRSARTITAE